MRRRGAVVKKTREKTATPLLEKGKKKVREKTGRLEEGKRKWEKTFY